MVHVTNPVTPGRRAPPSAAVSALVRAGAAASSGVIDDLDEISDTVCAVVDVAEVCRNTHPDARWVAAAERAYVRLQGYVQGLNSNAGMYNALVSAQERCGASLTPEAARVALTLRRGCNKPNAVDPQRPKAPGFNPCAYEAISWFQSLRL